jgi:hypothetical protein
MLRGAGIETSMVDSSEDGNPGLSYLDLVEILMPIFSQ